MYPPGAETMTTCPQCEGQGKVTCEKCSGTGKVQITEVETVSDMSHTSNTVTCPKCNGERWQLCQRCCGSGDVNSQESTDFFEPDGRDT